MTTPTIETFNADRDLAFEYLRAAIYADAHPAFGDRVCYATGILRKCLKRLQEAPDLIDGFDAYLTAVVGVLEHSAPDVDRAWLTHGEVYGPDFQFTEP